MNDSRLPTECLNTILRRLLGRRIYERFLEPGIIDAQEDYWPEREAGNRWMARWVLMRAYVLMLTPFARALRSVVLVLQALV